MAKMKNLDDLFLDEIKDIYNAEGQILKALPKMVKKASSERLKEALQAHLEQTETQKKRLEKVFEALGKKAQGKTCKAMLGLVEEGKEILEDSTDDETRDAGIIAAAQKVEHYEIASYGTVMTWAKQLGHTDVVKLLKETLDEEKDTDKLLSKLAASLNPKALK